MIQHYISAKSENLDDQNLDLSSDLVLLVKELACNIQYF